MVLSGWPVCRLQMGRSAFLRSGSMRKLPSSAEMLDVPAQFLSVRVGRQLWGLAGGLRFNHARWLSRLMLNSWPGGGPCRCKPAREEGRLRLTGERETGGQRAAGRKTQSVKGPGDDTCLRPWRQRCGATIECAAQRVAILFGSV